MRQAAGKAAGLQVPQIPEFQWRLLQTAADMERQLSSNTEHSNGHSESMLPCNRTTVDEMRREVGIRNLQIKIEGLHTAGQDLRV